MTPQTAALMAEYNRWMNERLYTAAAGLSPAEVTQDRGAFFGSLQQTLNHIAVGDTIWLHRFAQHPQASALRDGLARFPQPTSLRQALAETMAALWLYRQELDALIVGWAATLSSDQLGSALVYRNMAGKPFSRNFGFLVQHFFNHQTHHRGQASTLLFQAGIDIGETDLLAVIPKED